MNFYLIFKIVVTDLNEMIQI